jgi:hypothetical protein
MTATPAIMMPNAIACAVENPPKIEKRSSLARMNSTMKRSIPASRQ